MCGRYSQSHSLKALEAAFQALATPSFSADFSVRYNIAPSQSVAVVRPAMGGEGRELAGLRWGLVPGWMKEFPKAATMINARAETLADKPSFRAAYKRRRCLVPADGFYEWKKEADKKQPYYIQLPDQPLFAFAGLWEHWSRGEQNVESCTIITTDANHQMQSIHERMPVILKPEDYARWLGEEGGDETEAEQKSKLEGLLQPLSGMMLNMIPVSTYVNSPKHDDARCIEAI